MTLVCCISFIATNNKCLVDCSIKLFLSTLTWSRVYGGFLDILTTAREVNSFLHIPAVLKKHSSILVPLIKLPATNAVWDYCAYLLMLLFIKVLACLWFTIMMNNFPVNWFVDVNCYRVDRTGWPWPEPLETLIIKARNLLQLVHLIHMHLGLSANNHFRYIVKFQNKVPFIGP